MLTACGQVACVDWCWGGTPRSWRCCWLACHRLRVVHVHDAWVTKVHWMAVVVEKLSVLAPRWRSYWHAHVGSASRFAVQPWYASRLPSLPCSRLLWPCPSQHMQVPHTPSTYPHTRP